MGMQNKLGDFELETKILELKEKAMKYEKLNKMMFISVFLLMAITVGVLFLVSNAYVVYILAGVISFFMGVFLYSKIRMDSYKKKIKKVLNDNDFILNILLEYFNIKDYSKSKCIPQDIIKNSNLIEKYNEFKGKNYLSANYKGIDFEFSDINLIMAKTDRTSENLQKIRKAVFFGQWIICKTDYDFLSRITIKENIMQKKDYNNSDFNKRYTVISENEELALKYLNSKFKEEIINLNNKLNGFLTLDFNKNNIIFTLHNAKDSFDFDIKSNEVNDLKLLKESYKKEAEKIVSILDFLKENVYKI